MKYLNRLIITKIIEINFMILFLIISFPIWEKVNNEVKLASTTATSSHTYLEIDKPINYMMRPMSNDFAKDYLKPCQIKIINDYADDSTYTLVLKIAKTSTINVKDLNIAINNNIYELNNLLYDEDEENKYFLISQSNILTNDTYDVIFWLNEKTEDYLGKKLEYNFELTFSNKI